MTPIEAKDLKPGDVVWATIGKSCKLKFLNRDGHHYHFKPLTENIPYTAVYGVVSFFVDPTSPPFYIEP